MNTIIGSSQNSKLYMLAKAAGILLNAGKSPLFIGDRGLGKSSVAKQVAANLNRETYYFNCSQADAASLVYPVVSAEPGKPPSINLTTLGGLDGLTIILDEITNAREDLQSFLLSWVLEKRVGSTEFKDINFIATGNSNKQSSLANTLPRPLLERFCVLDFPAPTKDDWIVYMQTQQKAPSWYYAWIKKINEPMFYTKETEDGEVEDFKQRPSPRSHTQLANTLASLESPQEAQAEIEVIHMIAEGFVGNSAATSLNQYINDSSNFITYEEYLAGRKPQNATQIMNLVMSATDKLRDTVNNISTNPEKSAKILDGTLNKLIPDIHEISPNLVSFAIESIFLHDVRNKEAVVPFLFNEKDGEKLKPLTKIIKDKVDNFKRVVNFGKFSS